MAARLLNEAEYAQLTAWLASQLPEASLCVPPREETILDLCRTVGLRLQAAPRIEADRYGQGWASFIEAWYYRASDDFRRPGFREGEERYTGLFVLFSRLASCFCIGEGAKSWDARGESSFLPSFQMIDAFATEAVEAMVEDLERALVGSGFVRLHKPALAAPLPEEFHMETNLGDGQYRLFDALFHWYD